jgi:hypothetical protein
VVWTAKEYGFDSFQGKEIFSSQHPDLALGSTQPPIQWVPVTLFLMVKQQGHEADHSLPQSEVKNFGGEPIV